MERHLRNALGAAAQNLRRTLEDEYFEQLEGTFDVHRDGEIAEAPGAHLSPSERVITPTARCARANGLRPISSAGRAIACSA